MTPEKVQKNYRSAAFAAMALWPVLLFVLYSVRIRIQGKYFGGLLASSGLEGDTSLANVIFLYRQDLLLFGVVLPLLLAATVLLLRRALAVAVWLTLIALALLLLYANLQSWGQVGGFLSRQALANSISFALSNPEFVGEYVAADSLVKLGVLLAASVVVFTLAFRLKPGSRLLLAGALISAAGVACATALAAFGSTSRMVHAPITGSFFANAVDALVGSDRKRTQAVPDPELDGAFSRLSLQDGTEPRSANFGVESGSNLLLFVLETGSIEFLDTRLGAQIHPVLDRFKSGLFLSKNHYSTFPASAESNLSILTGMYPPRAIYNTCLVSPQEDHATIPGYIPALRAQGYETVLYAPFKSQVPADRVVFEHTGFSRSFYGFEHKHKETQGADDRTLEELTKDLTSWTSSGKKFAVAYFPQIGHGPWDPELGASIKERGHKVAMEQLDWLNGVVDILEKAGQLDKTVIVVTGDHGVRTTAEDPRTRVGMIDSYSLHVPLVVYAPHADFSAIDPSMPSSHVDLAAELAQLFGVERPRPQQGLSLGNPARASRRQFFVASWYYGADGYRDGDGSAMYSDPLAATYARKDGLLDFGSPQLVKDKAQSDRIRDTISGMLDLQESWIGNRACKLK